MCGSAQAAQTTIKHSASMRERAMVDVHVAVALEKIRALPATSPPAGRA